MKECDKVEHKLTISNTYSGKYKVFCKYILFHLKYKEEIIEKNLFFAM